MTFFPPKYCSLTMFAANSQTIKSATNTYQSSALKNIKGSFLAPTDEMSC